jgi:hypothetical protein
VTSLTLSLKTPRYFQTDAINAADRPIIAGKFQFTGECDSGGRTTRPRYAPHAAVAFRDPCAAALYSCGSAVYQDQQRHAVVCWMARAFAAAVPLAISAATSEDAISSDNAAAMRSSSVLMVTSAMRPAIRGKKCRRLTAEHHRAAPKVFSDRWIPHPRRRLARPQRAGRVACGALPRSRPRLPDRMQLRATAIVRCLVGAGSTDHEAG